MPIECIILKNHGDIPIRRRIIIDTRTSEIHVSSSDFFKPGYHPQYGAFPTDAYSHTPGFAGVQQPGMTGQVKEDVITRFCELGVKVSEGQIIFAPAILRREEFISEPANWSYWGSATEQCESLQSGSLAFTVCAVPVIYRLAQEYAIEVFDNDGGREIISGNQLGQARSLSLFQRDRRIQKIVVQIPRDVLR